MDCELVSNIRNAADLCSSNLGTAGLADIPMGLGVIFGALVQCLFTRGPQSGTRRNGKASLEAGLPLGMAGAILIQVGLGLFSATITSKIPWIVPMIGTFFCGLGVSGICRRCSHQQLTM